MTGLNKLAKRLVSFTWSRRCRETFALTTLATTKNRPSFRRTEALSQSNGQWNALVALSQSAWQIAHITRYQVQARSVGGQHDVGGVTGQKQAPKTNWLDSKTAQWHDAFFNRRGNHQRLTCLAAKRRRSSLKNITSLIPWPCQWCRITRDIGYALVCACWSTQGHAGS